MFDRGLKTLVINTALLPSLIVALGLGTFLSISRLQDIDELARERGAAAAMQLAVAARPMLRTDVAQMRAGLQADLQADLQEIAALALEERGVRAVSIYDGAGRAIAHAGPQLQQPLAQLPTAMTLRPLNTVEQFIQPVLPASQYTASFDATDKPPAAATPLGWITLEYSRQHQWLSRYRTVLIGSLVAALAVIAAFTLAAYTSRRFGRALGSLRDGIREIENGHLDRPIDFQGDHLLEQLAGDLNRMATRVHGAQIELQRSLEQTNRDLRESLDIVEVQNIEIDLARREALEASRIKSEFLANTSHELRTPLNGIIGFTRLLVKSPLEPWQRDYLETIRHSSESLLSIINDILDFSKIEAGKLVIDSMPFSLRDLIEDTLAILAPSRQEKQLQLTLDYAADVPADLIGDPLRLRQILLNLIGNAIKFTLQGSVTVRVHLTAPVSEGNAPLEIEINDTGIGLSDDQQKKMFKPFAQADASTSRLFGGTGLGLVISKKLIEQMGGEIAVESAPNQGSTFTISLRLQILNKTPARELPAPVVSPQLPGLQVLAVDDNPTNLRLLALMLEELGIETWLATGGHDALTLAQTHHFDLILLDIQMPEIDGRAVAQQLRSTDNPNRETRLVALTAHVLPEEHRALLTLGFDLCLTKPITEEQLHALLTATDTPESPPAVVPPRPVDIALCLQRARQKPDLARDMLAGVLDMLPSVQQTLTTADLSAEQLLTVIHKLHGACCYTGTPQLQLCSLRLEEALKQQPSQEDDINEGKIMLHNAIKTLITWQKQHDLDVLFELEQSS
ncbi:MAG: ATP-binding protein [Spongiibacteraceae bacterium]